MQLTFDRVLKTHSLRSSRYRSQPSLHRPVFSFDFSDRWTFGRGVKPTLPTIKDFSNQVFEVNLDELAMLASRSLRARIGADELWQSLSSEWPILILSDIEIGKPGFRDAVVELLKRHSIEWQNFSRLVEHQRLPYAA